MHRFSEPIRPLCMTYDYVGPTRSLTQIGVYSYLHPSPAMQNCVIQMSWKWFKWSSVPFLVRQPDKGITDNWHPSGTLGNYLSVLDMPVVRLGPINRPMCPVKVGLREWPPDCKVPVVHSRNFSSRGVECPLQPSSWFGWKVSQSAQFGFLSILDTFPYPGVVRAHCPPIYVPVTSWIV